MVAPERRLEHSIHGACNFAIVHRSPPVRDQSAIVKPPRPTASGSSDGPCEEPACYICLGTEGPMLVNVCACRWSRVHEACLVKLLKQSNTCGVCKQQLLLEPRALLSTSELLCRAHPCCVRVHALSSLFVALLAMLLLAWSLGVVGESRTTMPCVFILGHAIYGFLCLRCSWPDDLGICFPFGPPGSDRWRNSALRQLRRWWQHEAGPAAAAGPAAPVAPAAAES